jgi:dihydroxynaphthoic acid synthetase
MTPGTTVEDLDLVDDLGEIRVLRSGPVCVAQINRPERLNAFTSTTIDQLIEALRHARAEQRTGAIVLCAAGERAFSVGGDQKQRAELGHYGHGRTGRLATEELYRVIRECPKPVIAAVNGYALGGGHVIHLVCDLTVASDGAVFAQPGPQVGSFDAGYGSVLLARAVGEKRARQMLLLGERVPARTALEWGLVNAVVPQREVLGTALEWAARSCALSPTALAVLKHSLNADTEHVAGIGRLCFETLMLFGTTPEAQEGYRAFVEKRDPDFGAFRAGVPEHREDEA